LRSAREAVIETLPLYEMARMRAATIARRHPVHGFAGGDRTATMPWANQLMRMQRLLGLAD